jgi:hypothetical protein
VRGVAIGQLWLGPALVERIPSLSTLEAACKVSVSGAGLRLDIATDNSLTAVEEAILPLLPGSE